MAGPKKRGSYKPKNRLDAFLQHEVGGKYKWRRYEIFTDFLRSMSWQEPVIKERIAGWKAIGVTEDFLPGLLRDYMRGQRKIRAQTAAAAKWKKSPKTS